MTTKHSPPLNPHDPSTPEWQLYENWRGMELEAQAAIADSERAFQRAAAIREKARKYRAALDKLEFQP